MKITLRNNCNTIIKNMIINFIIIDKYKEYSIRLITDFKTDKKTVYYYIIENSLINEKFFVIVYRWIAKEKVHYKIDYYNKV